MDRFPIFEIQRSNKVFCAFDMLEMNRFSIEFAFDASLGRPNEKKRRLLKMGSNFTGG